MSFSQIFEKFDRVLTGDAGLPFLKTGVTTNFLSISGKVPLLIQLFKISVSFS